MPVSKSPFCSVNNKAAHSTNIPDKVSKATIIFFLFALSARIPPKGESRIVGIVAIDKILTNIVADPLVFYAQK